MHADGGRHRPAQRDAGTASHRAIRRGREPRARHDRTTVAALPDLSGSRRPIPTSRRAGRRSRTVAPRERHRALRGAPERHGPVQRHAQDQRPTSRASPFSWCVSPAHRDNALNAEKEHVMPGPMAGSEGRRARGLGRRAGDERPARRLGCGRREDRGPARRRSVSRLLQRRRRHGAADQPDVRARQPRQALVGGRSRERGRPRDRAAR